MMRTFLPVRSFAVKALIAASVMSSMGAIRAFFPSMMGPTIWTPMVLRVSMFF